jgi:hypothetical protein
VHVFLSYSRRDAAFVGRLADDLAIRGIDPWLDTDDLPVDDEDRWRRAVVKGIRGSDAVVLVLSPDSVRSTAVERELTIASELTRRIIPIVHRACDLSDGLMFDLAGLQRTDFVDQPYDLSLGQLVHRIRAESSTDTDTHANGTVHPDPGPNRNRHAGSDDKADAHPTHTQATAQTSEGSTLPKPRWSLIAAMVSFVAALTIVGIVALGSGGDDGDAGGGSAATTPESAVVAATNPSLVPATDLSDGSARADEPGSSPPGTAEQSTLVPWDEATAIFERRDGTAATVTAPSVMLACDTGRLRFENGQTISLQIVESVRFDSVDMNTATAAGAVTLLDGRELTDPIFTWNCPVSGTTDLGPLSIELDDIRRINFDR